MKRALDAQSQRDSSKDLTRLNSLKVFYLCLQNKVFEALNNA
jgi:hypothetical protein